MNYPQPSASAPSGKNVCYHCGAPLRDSIVTEGEKTFCCHGCHAVFQLLTDNGLADFYKFGETARVRIQAPPKEDAFAFLDDPSVRKRLVDFADENITRVTFRVPDIHCIACVWLLENLFRLRQGIGRCEVNFLRKEVLVAFEHSKVALGEVAALLASLGYPPELNLSDLEGRARSPVSRRLWIQMAVAGFAFGNTMLFSIPSYLGLDKASGQRLTPLFGWLSFLLATPVLLYSAADYWRAAWAGLRQRRLTIEVPITAGIAALFAQSTWVLVAGRGEGYFDSFCGLMFFLLCGKMFQQKTYDRLAFERDYKSFFPLSVTRKKDGIEERVSLSRLQVGDRLMLRNGELIPADARLVSGMGRIDYSFVTGESRPVHKSQGDHLYCGGRQTGGSIEIEMVKDVSQSQLSSLWNQEAFRKEKGKVFDTLTNRYSEQFGRLVIAVAVCSAIFWWFREPGVSFRAFTAVLIVACPCALALAAPFALGTAQRILTRRGVFLKNAQVVETLAQVKTVVFDKTGTLTTIESASPVFEGRALVSEEERWVASLARHSTHPYAAQIFNGIADAGIHCAVHSFIENPGAGIEGMIEGRVVWMGSAAWLTSRGITVPRVKAPAQGGEVHLAVDHEYRGRYLLAGSLRPEIECLARKLSGEYELALISGDNDREQPQMRELFGKSAPLLFNQSPLDKLNFIEQCQLHGKVVMMVGDGLNDAGALQQSDAGVAVVENINAFSPASDVIMTATAVPQLNDVLRFAKDATRVVRVSFLISALYNIVGLGIAARGLLSPVVCAILMPLSSVTVMTFACGMTACAGRRMAARHPKRGRIAVPVLNLQTLHPANAETSAGAGGLA